MNVDLTIINFTGQDAASYKVRYARIDNTTNPVWINAGTLTSAQFPHSIPNVPNGTYQIGITPVYSDLRKCDEVVKMDGTCVDINSINAVIDGANFKVTYSADDSIPQVYLKVTYPNGGSFQQAYTNGANGSTILVPIPTGVYGDYQFYMQSVCDPVTGYYGNQTPPVTVEVAEPQDYNYVLSPSYGVNIYSVTGTGIPTLPPALSGGGNVTGLHGVVSGTIVVTLTGAPYLSTKIDITVNGLLAATQNITTMGAYNFPGIVAAAADLLRIEINSF